MLNLNRALIAGVVVLAASLTVNPAWGQSDLTGVYGARYSEDYVERIPGPALIDYLGLPMNDQARQWALAWDPSRYTLPEHQCQVHTAAYIYRGPLQLRIWEERDPSTQELIAIKQYISTYEQERTIWMDGRDHPSPNAAHTWMEFSTGEWDGPALTVTTTHIKQGWHRRNGFPSSDHVRLREHFFRHGDYLTGPLIKTQNFVLTINGAGNWLWPCEYVIEVDGQTQGDVPNYLPNENPFVDEFADRHGIPLDAALGGAKTMYPEYMETMRNGGRD